MRTVRIDDTGDPQDPYEEFLAEGSPEPLADVVEDEDDAISINYTSGTTGKPKGAVYHHRGAYLNALGEVIERCRRSRCATRSGRVRSAAWADRRPLPSRFADVRSRSPPAAVGIPPRPDRPRRPGRRAVRRRPPRAAPPHRRMWRDAARSASTPCDASTACPSCARACAPTRSQAPTPRDATTTASRAGTPACGTGTEPSRRRAWPRSRRVSRAADGRSGRTTSGWS